MFKLNFPNKINREKKEESTSKKPWNHNMANKGMGLEDMINKSNEYYLTNNIAVIHKKPIPIQIVHVKYPARNKAMIDEAYYKTPSTTDYNGVYMSKYIDFDAKECNSLTSFPLKNVHTHQTNHLNNIIKHGGIGFLIIYFNKYSKCYILTMDQFNKFLSESLNGGRQSIPYSFFEENCKLVKEGYNPRLDYLDAISDIYNLKESN
jgi:recombination protein U